MANSAPMRAPWPATEDEESATANAWAILDRKIGTTEATYIVEKTKYLGEDAEDGAV